MRITICCKHFGSNGGAEAFLLNFVRRLREEGHRIKVIALKANVEVEGVQIVRLRVASFAAGLRDLAIARASRKALATEDADVTFSDQKCLGAQVVRVGGGVQREYLRQYEKTYRNAARRTLHRALRAVSLKERLRLYVEDRLYQEPGLRCIIANSDMVRRQIARQYPQVADRIRVVYNGVDTERLTPALKGKHRARIRQELGIPPDALVGVFVGHGWRRKGLRTFIEALGILARKDSSRPVHGIVVGKGNQRSAQRLARKCDAGERIRFVGAAEPDRFYGASDLLVLPTYYDPCANVTLEGLACGLPAITSAHNGAHELLTPGKDGFYVCDAADAGGLAGFIEHFLDEKRLAAASEAARALALDHTQDRQYRELIEAITSVVG